MNKIFIKTRNQLLFAFSCFTLLGIIIALVSIFFFSKLHEIYKVTGSLHTYYEKYIKAVDSEQEFLSLELGKSEYFKTGESRHLALHDQYLSEMKQSLLSLQKSKAFTEFGIEKEINAIDLELNKYETLFGLILDKVKVKGFRDYGLEGKMSEYVYTLEKMSAPIGIEHVLVLRKHEKDYLLRNDSMYISRLGTKVEDFKNLIWSNPNISKEKKEKMNGLLQNYYLVFMQLVNITKEIGYKDEKGLSDLLNQSKNQIEDHFHALFRKAEIKETILIENVQSSFYIVIVNLLLTSLFLIYIFTRKIRIKEPKNLEASATSLETSAMNVLAE
jgi:hypothetical protein